MNKQEGTQGDGKAAFFKLLDIDKKEPIAIVVSSFNGKPNVHIRAQYYNDNKELKPTKKGVVFPVDDIDTVIEGLQAAKESLTHGKAKN